MRLLAPTASARCRPQLAAQLQRHCARLSTLSSLPSPQPPPPPPREEDPLLSSSLLSSSPYFQLAQRLARSRSATERLGIRFSHFLKRSRKPWTLDDVLALVSWLFIGHSLLFLLGTTFAVSLTLWVARAAGVGDAIARRAAAALAGGSGGSGSDGYTVRFDSAIIPRWRDGLIRVSNVRIRSAATGPEPRVDVTIRSVDVRLSLLRWLDGKGIVQGAVVHGVRGTLDYRPLNGDGDAAAVAQEQQQQQQLAAAAATSTAEESPVSAAAFDLSRFELEDLQLQVLYGGFRPYAVSVFSMECGRLRGRWLLWDVLGADYLVGMYDGCLFSVHTPRATQPAEELKSTSKNDDDDDDERWKRPSRFKIDGLPIDHLNAGAKGPFGWICEGTVDVHAQMSVPRRPRAPGLGIGAGPGAGAASEEEDFLALLSKEWVDMSAEIARRWEEIQDVGLLQQSRSSPARNRTSSSSSSSNSNAARSSIGHVRKSSDDDLLNINFDLKFNNLKARVPLLQTESVSLLGSALARPIVAYLNAHRSAIPLNCDVQIPIAQFNGACSIYQCGLVDALSNQVGNKLTHQVIASKERTQRLRRIGIWSVQSLSRSLVSLWEEMRGTRMFFGSLV